MAAEECGQRGLRAEELSEDHHAAFAAGERRDELAFTFPIARQRRVREPGALQVVGGEVFQRTAPRLGAAAGGLEQQASPEAGLRRGQGSEVGTQFGFPRGPEGEFDFVHGK